MKAVRLLLLAAVLAGAACAQASAAPITAEALLAADVPWATVRQVAGPNWWPSVPQFESPPLYRDPTPTRPVAVVSQWYNEIDGDVTVLTKLLAFKAADPQYCQLLLDNDGEPFNARAPAVGTNHAYWTVVGDGGSAATVFCFERGPVAVEIKVYGARWSTGKIERLARPIDANVQALLAGRLAILASVPAALARLPGRADAPGRVLGTAVLPAEAWAANAGKPTPQQILGQLSRGGSKSLLFRRYVLADKTNVVDVTLFSFTSAGAATGWFKTLARASGLAGLELDPGATGKQAGLWEQDEYYALDFVAGRAVADITCYAPYGETPSPSCPGIARKLAERWYAQLARG